MRKESAEDTRVKNEEVKLNCRSQEKRKVFDTWKVVFNSIIRN